MTIGPIGDFSSMSSKHDELELSKVMTTNRWDEVPAESELGNIISAWKVRDELPPVKDMPRTK